MKNEKFIVVSGYFFIIVGVLDLFLKIWLFGFLQFDFLWFCSLSMFVLGFGMILKNDMLLNSFLAIALIVQPFWITDFILFSFFNIHVNGLSSYVFQPGFSFMEFLDNSKHLFMIPFGIYAVFTVSRRNFKSYFFTPFLVAFILIASYILPPNLSNLNCVVKPCLKILGRWSGMGYSLVYLFSIIVLSLVINLMINIILKKVEKLKSKKFYKKCMIIIFIVLVCFASASVFAAYLKYLRVPQYVCLKPSSCDNCSIKLECNYVNTDSEKLALLYTIKNYGHQNYVCNIFMRIYPNEGKFTKIVNGSFIESGRKYEVDQILPYPLVDSQIGLKSDCKVYT